jgi:hypothetical protein
MSEFEKKVQEAMNTSYQLEQMIVKLKVDYLPPKNYETLRKFFDILREKLLSYTPKYEEKDEE